MRFFLSAGEPSGDIHAANLARELRRRAPGCELRGLGGGRLAEAGATLLAPLADTPIMGFVPAIAAAPRMFGLLRQVENDWKRRRPDAVVLIDYPGFHWHVARAARRQRIPVVSFVPPQVWAWASWRVVRLRRYFDLILCSLPFEETWLRDRRVPQARYIGHPFFDDLADRKLRPDVLQAVRPAAGQRVVALLPGSRGSEVRRNAATLLRVATELAPQHPDVAWHVAAFGAKHARHIGELAAESHAPVHVHFGRTPEILSVATCAAAVSGSVSLELLHYGVPTVFVYQTPRAWDFGPRQLLLNAEHIALTNLMAGRRAQPEFVGGTDLAPGVAAALSGWLHHEPARQAVADELAALRARHGNPGAVAAAADALMTFVAARTARRAA